MFGFSIRDNFCTHNNNSHTSVIHTHMLSDIRLKESSTQKEEFPRKVLRNESHTRKGKSCLQSGITA